MSVKIGLERGFESLAFEWGHDFRIAQQGEKVMYHFLLCDGRHDMSGASQSSE